MRFYFVAFCIYFIATYTKYVLITDNGGKFIECIAPWILIPLAGYILFFIILSAPEKKSAEAPQETESQMLQRHEREIRSLNIYRKLDIKDLEEMFDDFNQRLNKLRDKLEDSLTPKVPIETPEENKAEFIDNILN